MEILAIITARGGSKRIPKKNIKDFFGKPVIAYAIETTLKSKIFDEVMVSTDCEEIAKIAEKYGAKVPFIRSKKNSDEISGTVDVLLEVIGDYKKIGYNPKYACCIYPVTPLMTKKHYIAARDKLINGNFDSVFPVAKYDVPIEWAMKIEGDKIIPCDKELIKSSHKDLVSKYHDTGQFYFFNTESLLKKKSLFTDNTSFIELNSNEYQDVDYIADWELLEIKWKNKNLNNVL